MSATQIGLPTEGLAEEPLRPTREPAPPKREIEPNKRTFYGLAGMAAAPAPLERAVAHITVAETALHRTAIGMVGERMLRALELDLRAYLYGQLGERTRVDEALAHLRDGFDGRPEDAPSPRARVYRMARELGAELRSGASGRAVAPYAAPTAPRPAGYDRMLAHLRLQLPAEEAELLELRFARGLTIAELAYVLGGTFEGVAQRVDAALAWTRAILEPCLGGVRPEPAYVINDAFQIADEEETPATVALPYPVGTAIGRYVIESHVGGGAFGHVYRARDREIPTHIVALKVLHRPALTSEARARGKRELELVASAFHPALVQLKDHGFHERRLFCAMPWLEGETLAARLRRGPMEVEEAAALLEPIARALAALHATGTRHQDVKPDNVLLAALPGGQIAPVLLDLGVAAHDTDTVAAGTPLYFAPEIARRVVDPEACRAPTDRADVFALALTFVHAVSREVRGTSDLDVFLKKRAEGVKLPPLSRSLRERVPRWLATDPSTRPSATEIADELKALCGKPRRVVRPKTTLVAALCLSLGALTSGATMFAATELAHDQAQAAKVTAAQMEHRAALSAKRAADSESRALRVERELAGSRTHSENTRDR